MKNKVNILSEVLVLVFLTLMIVIDFFPDIGISMSVGVIGVVTFIILSIITRQKGKSVFNPRKQELIIIVCFGLYIFTVLLILRLLGGQSQVGIELTNPLLWGLYLIGITVAYSNYKKELKQLSNNGGRTFQ